MKKLLLTVLAIAMILAGCSARSTLAPETTESPAEVTTEETEPPTEPKPRTVEGKAMVDNTPIALAVFHRGDKVDVVGSLNDEKVIVKTAEGYGVMDAAVLTMTDGEEYAQWQGYPRWNAAFYGNCNLFGEPIQNLSTNPVRVLDEMGNCYVIEVGDQIGYVAKADVSRYRYSGGGGGGGGAGGGSADGGDISLAAAPTLYWLATFRQEGTVTGTAIVKGDGAEALLGTLEYEESVSVVVESGFAPELDGYCTVYVNDLYGYVREGLVALPDAEAFEPWTGYSRWGTEMFGSLYLHGEVLQKLGSNTEVEVLWELESCYYIRVNDAVGYVSKTLISPTRFSTGGGGGGSSGGGESWSPPML